MQNVVLSVGSERVSGLAEILLRGLGVGGRGGMEGDREDERGKRGWRKLSC